MSCNSKAVFKSSHAISFPKGDDLLRVIRGYEETWSFPMCAGAVDGTHIPILAPNKNHTDYVNHDLNREICGVEIPPVILADPAYPLLSWVLKGYPRNEATRSQRVFNYRLIRARMTASCVLHNIFEALKNEFLPDWADAEELIEEPILPIDETPAPDAELFRDALAEYFTS
ncbi:Hypothetical predicted protein [Paramuricea clavata]|uniref:Uncharacterized protein n=1 Tax=Paramuricea clavata TaxID=317549 RepID=A0A6S7FYY6_PARCT|nr:Hypothetical predicted protein [Paramuricea clavata]